MNSPAGAREAPLEGYVFGVPGAAQRSGCGGERRSKGAGGAFAEEAEAEQSGLYDAEGPVTGRTSRTDSGNSVIPRISIAWFLRLENSAG